MGDSNYVNRLVDWIETNLSSQTAVELISAELEHLGGRLDALVGAGSKGAHAQVTKLEASRFLTGTYVLLGDILLAQSSETAGPASESDMDASA